MALQCSLQVVPRLQGPLCLKALLEVTHRGVLLRGLLHVNLVAVHEHPRTGHLHTITIDLHSRASSHSVDPPNEGGRRDLRLLIAVAVIRYR